MIPRDRILPACAALALPLAAGALLFACLGANPLKAYQAMLAEELP